MDNEQKYCISELFSSISGEGITAGFPAVFVRVGGCNLRCSYCDTVYAQEFENSDYRHLTASEILEEVKSKKIKQVICTGGEPLCDENRGLPLFLARAGFDVRIETNGSVPLYSSEERGMVEKGSLYYALDIKCPSSKMEKKDIFLENVRLLCPGDELKFVIGSMEDFEYALEKISRVKESLYNMNIILNFSSVYGKISYQELSEMLLEKSEFFHEHGLSTRLNLQLHKIIWTPEARGV